MTTPDEKSGPNEGPAKPTKKRASRRDTAGNEVIGYFSQLCRELGITEEVGKDVLKKTVFKQRPKRNRNGDWEVKEITNAHLAMMIAVVNDAKLNPFRKEIYAYPDDAGGIVPVVGVDGWARILNENPLYDGVVFEWSEEWHEAGELDPPGVPAYIQHKACPKYIRVTIYVKGRTHPTVIEEYLDECYRPPFKKNRDGREYYVKGPWQTHTKRFLRHKGIVQDARIALSFSGIYDEDEADRILSERDVTNEVEVVSRETGAKPAGGLAAALEHNAPDEMTQAVRQAAQQAQQPEPVVVKQAQQEKPIVREVNEMNPPPMGEENPPEGERSGPLSQETQDALNSELERATGSDSGQTGLAF